MRLSFKYKFILSFLTIEIFFISLIVFFNFASLTNLSHSLIDEKIQTETALFREMVKSPMIVYDLGMLDNQVENFANIKSIAAVKVLDNRERVLSSVTKVPNFDIDRFEKISDEIIFNGRIFRLEILPITLNGEVLGKVKVLFDLTQSHQVIDKNRRLTFLLILIEIMFSTMIAYGIGHKLTNGLNRLTLSAQHIADNDQIRIPYVGSNGDEMSILSNALHIMQERIVERNKNLYDTVNKLQDSTIQLQLLLDAMSEGVYGVDKDGLCTFVNSAFLKILGYLNAHEVIGKNIHELIHHTHSDGTAYPSCECLMKNVVKNQLAVNVSNEVFWHKNGSAIAVEYWSNPIVIHGECVGAMATFVDITERKKIENELFKLSQGIEQNPHSIVITDLDGNIEYVNAAFINATGYTALDVIGRNPKIFQSGKTSAATYQEMWMCLNQGMPWAGEFINRKKNGNELIQSITISPIYQNDGKITHYMAIEEDITERKQSEKRIHYLANFDPLTGLPNRTKLDENLNYILNLAKRNDVSFAVMFLDLDHFKDINDTLGHNIGDILLIELSKRLQSILRDEDTVSRMGGDEFIGLFPSVNEHGAKSIAQKILGVIAQPFIIAQHTLTVTGSIGIALYPSDGIDKESLSKSADIAMYRAKKDGRNGYCFFTEEMQMHSMRNLQLVHALHHAIEYGQLQVVYQPQLSAKSGQVIGTEALLRWNHPELGNISPAEFIPIAEESGLILSIGEWVLRTAVQHTKRWVDMGLPPIMMAVNISAVQFRHPSLPGLVSSILNEEGLLPQYLELELTEGVAMNNPLAAIAIMDDLHARGVRMSIDDFGTGYSSLSYLKKFKVYKLKIDQSFVRDITTDPEDKAIVGAVISMAHSLGLQTIAEGVETIGQLEYLREQGCDEIQGYYYSKPLSAELLESFLRERSIPEIN